MNKIWTVLLILLIAHPSYGGISFSTFTTQNGTKLEYLISLPAKPRFFMLAIPPGPGTKQMVKKGITKWLQKLRKSQVAVVSPVAPGKLFFQGAEQYIPELLIRVKKKLKRGNIRFALFGISNGGIGAFRVATLYPQNFSSLTVAPGFAKPEDLIRLKALKSIPVQLFVGNLDGKIWVKKANETHSALLRNGIKSQLTVVPGEGHAVAQSIAFKKLMAALFQKQ